MSLTLTVLFTPVLNDGTNLSIPQTRTVVPFTGTHGISYNLSVPLSDTSIDLGSVSTIGYVRIANLAQVIAVTTPAAPVITNHGTPGSTNDSYKIVALQSDGTYSAASSAGSTSTANATLDTSNYNIVTWTAVSGATQYQVYRTVAAGTPSTTGLIATVNAPTVTLNDTGLAGDSSSAPSVAADNLFLMGHTSGTYPISLKGTEVGVFRWNGASFAAIHVKSNTRIVPCQITVLDN